MERAEDVVKRVVVALALATLGCGPTTGHPLQPPTARLRRTYRPIHQPPSNGDVLGVVGVYSDLEASDVRCERVANGDITLGGMEAHLLSQLAEVQAGGVPAEFLSRCDGQQAPPWPCLIGTRIGAEESPRVTFTLSADGAIDPASIRCPGTG